MFVEKSKIQPINTISYEKASYDDLDKVIEIFERTFGIEGPIDQIIRRISFKGNLKNNSVMIAKEKDKFIGLGCYDSLDKLFQRKEIYNKIKTANNQNSKIHNLKSTILNLLNFDPKFTLPENEWHKGVRKNDVYFHTLGVHKNYRKKGIGTGLITARLDFAKQEGKRAVFTYANENSIKLYEKLGFTKMSIFYDGEPRQTFYFCGRIL